MTARRPFYKWRRWNSIGAYPYIQVLCHLSMELIFKATLKLESGNKKIQYGWLAAILKLTLLKINRLLHIYISIVLLMFGVDIQSQTKVRVWKPKNQYGHQAAIEIEIPKETWLMLRKPCRLQTDGRTDRRTDGRTRWIQYTPLPTSLGGGITTSQKHCKTYRITDRHTFLHFDWWGHFFLIWKLPLTNNKENEQYRVEMVCHVALVKCKAGTVRQSHENLWVKIDISASDTVSDIFCTSTLSTTKLLYTCSHRD